MTLLDEPSNHLDMDSIEVSSESFVDYKLAAHHSDILIRTKMRSSPVLVYILVEHKSHPERWTVFQLLKYMVRIWQQERAQPNNTDHILSRDDEMEFPAGFFIVL